MSRPSPDPDVRVAVASEAAPETLAAELYRPDPERYARERRAIFGRGWQLIAHESELAAPGDFVAETLGGFPILAVRGEDGRLRAFHNVCRHRAGPLSQAPRGRCEAGRLTCRYHGWTYALDGRLRAARDFGPAEGFDPRDFALLPAALETFRGLVFVCPGDPDAPLADLLRPLEERIAGRDWSDLRPAARRSHPLRCDWKTYVENYLEGYHIPLIHPGLDAEIDSARYAVEVAGRLAFHQAPVRAADAVYDGVWAWAWPNTAFNVYGRGLMMERMSPAGPGACRLDYLYLTPGGEPVPEATLALSDAVVAEDLWVVERVQENLDAGVYRAGRLSARHEAAVAAFQALYGAAMAPG